MAAPGGAACQPRLYSRPSRAAIKEWLGRPLSESPAQREADHSADHERDPRTQNQRKNIDRPRERVPPPQGRLEKGGEHGPKKRLEAFGNRSGRFGAHRSPRSGEADDPSPLAANDAHNPAQAAAAGKLGPPLVDKEILRFPLALALRADRRLNARHLRKLAGHFVAHLPDRVSVHVPPPYCPTIRRRRRKVGRSRLPGSIAGAGPSTLTCVETTSAAASAGTGCPPRPTIRITCARRSEEHTSELQSRLHL